MGDRILDAVRAPVAILEGDGHGNRFIFAANNHISVSLLVQYVSYGVGYSQDEEHGTREHGPGVSSC